MSSRVTAFAAAVLFAAAGSIAQPTAPSAPSKPTKPAAPEAAKTLKVGDKAPVLSIEQWVKGDKVERLEQGKVYVVEFWATWCPPCRDAIPHLTEVQKKWKDKGLTVIGVASSERGSSANEKLEGVKTFVGKQADKMNYTVAYDDDRSMSRDWMQPAGQTGIPCAFLVGHDGKIAFIGAGYPMAGFDAAVEKALKDAKHAALDTRPAIVPASYMQPAGDAKPADKKEPAKEAPAVQPLMLGDKAPALSVAKFVKGEPVTGFEKGKTYVVEFWATWCGPCKESIPHLTELQKQNKDVKFVGVSVWENNQADVEPFVKEMGDKMNYTIAMDETPAVEGSGRNAARAAASKGKMATTWMQAAGQGGIPTAFVVNGEGRVAWIGHPMDGLDDAVVAVASGKWDLDAKVAEYKKQKDNEAKLKPIQKEIRAAAQAGDWDRALAAMDKALELDPKNTMLASSKYRVLLMEAKNYDRAYAWGNTLVDNQLKDDAQSLNEIAWLIVDPDGNVEKKDLKLAMKAATRASELKKNEDPAILDTLAKVTHDSGDLAKAIELQEKAVKLSKGSEFEQELSERLDDYKEEMNKKKGGNS